MNAKDERKAQAMLARQLAESFGWVVMTEKEYASLVHTHGEFVCGAWHRKQKEKATTASQ